MIKSTDLAYAAGYFDGDGCFHIGKTRSDNRIRYRAAFIINSTEVENVQWFQKIFGGKISSRKRRKSNHKIIYRYVLAGQETRVFDPIFHFLIEKRKEFIFFKLFRESSDIFSKESLIEELSNYKNSFNLVERIHIKELNYIKKTAALIEEDFAYLAGFVDAECCLCIQKSFSKNRPNATYKIQLQCNNSKYPTFEWIAKRFGGQFHFIDRSKYRNHRNQITWRLSSAALYPILQKIQPFLKHKKPVCDELIKFYQTTFRRSGRPSPNSAHFTEFYRPILEEREAIFHKIQQLNKKGI